jgi:uncharacterized protein YbjT (DUF2867 family)
MKLLVLGATGGTGRQVVSQALEAGHEVTAYVRNPTNLERALQGQDAVVSTLGRRKSFRSGQLFSRSMRALARGCGGAHLEGAAGGEDVRKTVVVSY